MRELNKFLIVLYVIYILFIYLFTRLQTTWTSRTCWTWHVRPWQTWSRERPQKRSGIPSISRMILVPRKRRRFGAKTSGLLSDFAVGFLSLMDGNDSVDQCGLFKNKTKKGIIWCKFSVGFTLGVVVHLHIVFLAVKLSFTRSWAPQIVKNFRMF